MRLNPDAMRLRRTLTIVVLLLAGVGLLKLSGLGLWAASSKVASPSDVKSSPKVCEFAPPGAAFSIPYVAHPPELNSDPESPAWAKAASTWITKDCSHEFDYPKLKTEVRGFWTDSDLYLLFVSPYTELNLWLPADSSKDRLKLWDRDVVEFFLGDDWQNIKRYKEFEVAPTGDWVDLEIDLSRDFSDAKWNSGWQRQGRIDEKNHVWYAAARVPLRSVSEKQVAAGTKWRVNLYRIDGLGEDPVRHFMCWQPTCVVNRDPNHVPEHFGTLVFEK
jgi:hypothetical protein